MRICENLGPLGERVKSRLSGLGAMVASANSGGRSAMPSNVRAFWWLSVISVLLPAIIVVWHLIFPTAHYLSVLAQLPPDLREIARRADLMYAVVGKSVSCVLTLGLAWLASFRRSNWARWASAIWFVVPEAIPFVLAAAYHQFDRYIADLPHENWANPGHYAFRILGIVAIVFVFSGNARPWFNKPAS